MVDTKAIQESKAEARKLKIAATKAANKELALAARARRTADLQVWLVRRREERLREWMQRDKEKSVEKIQKYIDEDQGNPLNEILGRLLEVVREKAPRPVEDQRLRQRVEERLFKRDQKVG